MKGVSGVFASVAKTKSGQRTWMPTAEKTMAQISVATMATVFAAPVNARSGRILQRCTVANTASVTTSTVTAPTISYAEVRIVEIKSCETLTLVIVWSLWWPLLLPVLYQDMGAVNAGSASVTPTTQAAPATAPWKPPPASPRTGRSVTAAVLVNAEAANAPTLNSRVQPVRSVPPAPASALSTSEWLEFKNSEILEGVMVSVAHSQRPKARGAHWLQSELVALSMLNRIHRGEWVILPSMSPQRMCAVQSFRGWREEEYMWAGVQLLPADQSEGSWQAAPAHRPELPTDSLQRARRQRLLVLLYLCCQEWHQGGLRGGEPGWDWIYLTWKTENLTYHHSQMCWVWCWLHVYFPIKALLY